ncbi:MAG: sortase [Candidatus Saccharibacteria bacterium]|nr:sortase [Candidatus Saccharibacteria bacterium]
MTRTKQQSVNRKAAASKRAATKPAKKASTAVAPRKQRLNFGFKVGALFILAAALLAYQPLMRRWQEKSTLASAPAPAPEITPEVQAATKVQDRISGKPVRLVIPSLNVDLQIADGIYNAKDQTWTLSKDKAHYALMTPEANNQEGNTFIYGHNRREVFASLSKLNVGETVTVHTENGHQFTYAFRSAHETSPTDDSLFSYQGAPILTLQTCSGLWYQNRYLMTFDLVEVI